LTHPEMKRLLKHGERYVKFPKGMLITLGSVTSGTRHTAILCPDKSNTFLRLGIIEIYQMYSFVVFVLAHGDFG